jgi:L,D-transpeptidase catalytic domain
MLRGPIRSVVVVAALFVTAFPAVAAASGSTSTSATQAAGTALPTPTTPTAPTTPGPPATKPAATASVTLYLPDAFFVHRHAVTVPRRVVHVVGIVRPYVAGQSVLVRATLSGRVIKSEQLGLTPSRNHGYGHFRVSISSPGSGRVVVTVTHAVTPQLSAFTAHRSYAALSERVGFGSTGRFVQLIQQRLAALHLYIPQTGVYDQGTGLALDAYHRLLHWGEGNESLDAKTISLLLDGVGSFKVRYAGHGRHAEGDLTLQVLALVDGSRVEAIYPISSGKPSTPTILGDFHVYSRVPGYLPDGMYFSDFFYSGYAIHGYDPAPDYPASHGCMRLPIVDAISVYNWMAIGDWVDVYY